MARGCLWTGGLLGLVLLVGCQNGMGPGDRLAGFPKQMVGVWQTEANLNTGARWGLRFEPDGSLKKIIHGTAGPINLAEGGTSGKTSIGEGEYMFVMGKCSVQYDPKTNILDVVIPVEYFRIELPSGVLEGSMTDRFTGPVPEQGDEWIAQRRTWGDMVGAAPVSKEFADKHPTEVVFHRVDLDAVGEHISQQGDVRPGGQ